MALLLFIRLSGLLHPRFRGDDMIYLYFNSIQPFLNNTLDFKQARLIQNI